MFIGHFAVGLGAKKWAPQTSLGTLFFAAQLVDLLWPIFLLVGLERVEIAPGITEVTPLDFVSYPITHSLFMGFVWSGIFAGVYWVGRKYLQGAVVCGVAVLSHWILDFLTHRPDLPLMPGGETFVGLGLWFSLVGTFVVEVCIFAVGIWFYIRATRSLDRVGTIGFWALIGFLFVIYLGNLFGEPPPNVNVLAWVGNAQWLLVVWGYWVDRHRESLV